MKIKKLIIENINSLYGHFEIDFEAPAFSGGIFAITGPTGSGKTTILDAICLALYSETPRMGVSRTETLSKGAKKGLASLDFEVDGKGYSAVCAMTAGGVVTHQLICDDKIIASGLRGVAPEVKRITGMDVNQFCRAVLLAQGKFDAFLTAKDSEKANILEQITGTDLYSRIARKINLISKESSQVIQQQEAVCNSRKLLEPEELLCKRRELSRLQMLHTVLVKEMAGCDLLLSSFKRIKSVRKALEDNMVKTAQLEQQKTDFLPDRERLVAGERAARIKSVYNKFAECSKLHKQTLDRRQELLNALPGLEQQSLAAGKKLEEESKQLDIRQKEHDALRQLAGEVSLLDRDIHNCEKTLTEFAAERSSAEKTLQKTIRSQEQLEESKKTLETERNACLHYLEMHAQDSSLPQSKARWGEQMTRIREQQQELKAAEKIFQETVQQKEKAEARAAAEKLLWESAGKSVQKAEAFEAQKKEELLQLLAGQTLEALEIELKLRQKTVYFLQKIQSLEAERSKLADGEPCPLCGSTVHPYAEGNIPRSSEEEKALADCQARFDACRDLTGKLEEAKRKYLESVNALVKAEGNMKAAVQDAENKSSEVEKLKERMEQLSLNWSENVARLTEELAVLEFKWQDFSCLPPEVDGRIIAYTSAVNRMRELDEKYADNSRQADGFAVQQKETAARIADIDKKINQFVSEKLQFIKKRQALFGERDPEKEVSSSDTLLKRARENWNRCSNENTRCAEALRQAGESLQKTETELAERNAEMKKSAAEFDIACQHEKMPEEEFFKSVLEEEEFTRLVKIRSELDTRTLALTEEKNRYDSELDALLFDFPPSFDEKSCSGELEKAEQEDNDILLLIGALDNELKSNAREFKLYQAELEKLVDLKKKFSVWQELDAMIGGNDGYRFKRIVQGITLNNLLNNANLVLLRMNRRYELVQRSKDKEQLKIDVIDHWQGSEIRPSENLSGGERFQISLALALGLSSMAGEKIRIDSLFLDEGFGTLDPNALELALQTLSSLQRSEGKTIGIISHVQALADNIASVIEVIPQGGGRSRLNGAGVSAGKKE